MSWREYEDINPPEETTMKVSELIGPALDWAVELAKANGVREPSPNYWLERFIDPKRRYLCESASTEWSRGGLLIEREKIATEWSALWGCWQARDLRHAFFSFTGPTPLVAAMRCYVASKLGDEVEIPEDLT